MRWMPEELEEFESEHINMLRSRRERDIFSCLREEPLIPEEHHEERREYGEEGDDEWSF